MKMSRPGSIFMQGLTKFRHRSLYANLVNDRVAPFFSSYITESEMSVDLRTNQISPRYVGMDVLIGSRGLSTYQGSKNENQCLSPAVCRKVLCGVKQAAKYTAAPFLFPIVFAVFLINSNIQTSKSTKRQLLHRKNTAKLLDVDSSINHLLPSVGSQQGTEPLTQSTLAGDQTMELAPSRRPLKLDPRQREMATHLNALGFEKYPVYIRGDTNSHAAIIVRKERKSFEEGWAVLWHWARGFEV
jgi:hypothetical protein